MKEQPRKILLSFLRLLTLPIYRILTIPMKKSLEEFSKAFLKDLMQKSDLCPVLESLEIYTALIRSFTQALRKAYALAMLLPFETRGIKISSRPICITSSDQGDLYLSVAFGCMKHKEDFWTGYDLYPLICSIGNSPEGAIELRTKEVSQ